MDKAVETLKQLHLSVTGIPCHVGLEADRKKLIDHVFQCFACLMSITLNEFSLQTVAEFGGFDILVSNAAVNPVFGPVLNVQNF